VRETFTRRGLCRDAPTGGAVLCRPLLPLSPRCPRRPSSALREDNIDLFCWRLQPLLPPLTDSTPTTPPLLQQTPTTARGAGRDVDRGEQAATPTATQLLLQHTFTTERGAGRDIDRDAASRDAATSSTYVYY
jgi:predicted small secreted protein